jgi:hypothetical protein
LQVVFVRDDIYELIRQEQNLLIKGCSIGAFRISRSQQRPTVQLLLIVRQELTSACIDSGISNTRQSMQVSRISSGQRLLELGKRVDVDAQNVVQHRLLEEVVDGALKETRDGIGSVVENASHVSLAGSSEVAFES